MSDNELEGEVIVEGAVLSPYVVKAQAELPVWKEYISWIGDTGIPSAGFQEPREPPTDWSLRIHTVEARSNNLIALSEELRILREEVRNLRSELENRPLTSSILIGGLNDIQISLQKPISIILEETDDECLARWPEVAEVFGIGPTLQEAISDLKKNIVNLYLDFVQRDKKSLGGFAIETWTTLKSYIVQVGDK